MSSQQSGTIVKNPLEGGEGEESGEALLPPPPPTTVPRNRNCNLMTVQCSDIPETGVQGVETDRERQKRSMRRNISNTNIIQSLAQSVTIRRFRHRINRFYLSPVVAGKAKVASSACRCRVEFCICLCGSVSKKN